jgi:multiple sugar transport system permease protein
MMARTAAAKAPARATVKTPAQAGVQAPDGAKVGWGLADLVVIVAVLLPVWWLIALSFKDPGTMSDGRLWPAKWTLENYRGIFSSAGFVRPLVNSLGIAAIATAFAVVIASMAAYAIARLDFPGKRAIVGASLLIAMFPAIALVTPLFNLWRILRLFDTWPGLIIPYISFALPLAIAILSSFFREIPWDLERAAQVDGATPAQSFLKVIVPLAAPGVSTATIIVFITCWNDFIYAITLTSTDRSRTVPAAIAFFTGSSQFETPIGSISAAAVIITIPVVLLVVFFQRSIIAGLTSGAVKG